MLRACGSANVNVASNGNGYAVWAKQYEHDGLLRSCPLVESSANETILVPMTVQTSTLKPCSAIACETEGANEAIAIERIASQ
jgi:hypothetical protein